MTTFDPPGSRPTEKIEIDTSKIKGNETKIESYKLRGTITIVVISGNTP